MTVRLCAAHECGRPVQRPGGRSTYCVAHTGLVWQFHRWLGGDPRHDVLSFDRDRGALDHGNWHPV